MNIPFNFRLTDFPVEAETLRLEVREFQIGRAHV